MQKIKVPQHEKPIIETQPSNSKRDTVILPVRIKRELLDKLQQRVALLNVSRNSWLNWAIAQGLRSHKKGG